MSQQPYTVPATANLLGEVVCWEMPTGKLWKHTDLIAALKAAGLDDSVARPLGMRNAFIRAVRAQAASRNGEKLLRKLEDGVANLVFQVTLERREQQKFEYDFAATIGLNKNTGVVSATDPALESAVGAAVAGCLEARKIADVTRLTLKLFELNADLFPIKWMAGVYFVPQMHAAFVAQIEKFIGLIGGSFRRFPVPDGITTASMSVTLVMADGIKDRIDEYEKALEDIRTNNGDIKTLHRARMALSEARNKIHTYQEYLGAHAIRLEDHCAYVAQLLTEEQERLQAQQAVEEPQIVIVN